MKILKKSLAMLLCLLMVISIVPLTASADVDVVEVDHVTVKTDSIFAIGEKLPVDFKADYTEEQFELNEVDWSETELYTEWDLKTGGAFTKAGDTFEKGRGYKLVLSFRSYQAEYDVKKFTLKTADNSYTSYKTSHTAIYSSSPGGYGNYGYITLAYFYIPFTEFGHKVSTYDELKSALLKNEDYIITLKNDIEKEVALGDSAGGEAAQLTVKGKKWLNLNGYKLNVLDQSDVKDNKDKTLESNRTLFTVPQGAELIVGDTRGNGEVVYDAFYISPGFSFTVITDWAEYKHIAQRNMFNVAGKLTVNGGKFVAGGTEEQYLPDEYCNAHQIAAGYIAKTEGSGEAVFNAGEFIGHTYKDFNSSKENFFVLSGNILINGGDFINEGTGSFADKTNNSKIKIISGSFDVITHSKFRIKNDSLVGNTCLEWFISPFNIPAGAWDANKAILLKDGKICFNPEKVYLEDYKEDDRIDIFTTDFYTAVPGFFAGQKSTTVSYSIGSGKFYHDYEIIPSYDIAYESKALPQFLADKGYKLNLRGTLFDPSGNKIFEEAEKDNVVSFYPKTYCKTPGTYTYKVSFVLTDKDGKLCGVNTYTVHINAVEPCETHDFYISSTTATCTTAGKNTEICKKCGYTQKTDTEALGHTFEKYEGQDQYSHNTTQHWKYCYRCDNGTDNNGIYSNSLHRYLNGGKVCTFCGYDKSCKPDYNAMDFESDATHHWYPCETHGEGVNCPNNHKMECEAHVAATDPKYFGIENANTAYNCSKGYRCEGCGNYFGETGNHKWEVVTRNEPTCKKAGSVKYVCAHSEKIDPHGNTVEYHYELIVFPPTGEHDFKLVSDTATCSKAGTATYKCSGCGDTKTEASPATGHIYGLVSDTATCSSAGTATYKCNTCSNSYTETSPAKGHNHIEDSYKAPTTDAEGEITYKCTGCGNVKKEKIDRLSVIKEPKTKSINYKDGVVIRPNFANIPEGAVIEWTVNNGNLNYSVDANGNLTAMSNASGNTTFTAKVKLADGTYMKDMYGKEVVDETTVTSNAGFFQKIIGFFKSLFGATKIHE